MVTKDTIAHMNKCINESLFVSYAVYRINETATGEQSNLYL